LVVAQLHIEPIFNQSNIEYMSVMLKLIGIFSVAWFLRTYTQRIM